jgi:hypothetical protein
MRCVGGGTLAPHDASNGDATINEKIQLDMPISLTAIRRGKTSPESRVDTEHQPRASASPVPPDTLEDRRENAVST